MAAPDIGFEGNGWANVATGAGGFSGSCDLQWSPFVSVFGHVSGATTITVQVSQDGTTWYDSQSTQVLAGAADFCIHATIGARYVRLKSSANITATATLAGKG